MFEAIQLSCSRNEQLLFSQLSFSLKPGEILQIIGSNGSGKTSLLRLLTGLVIPDEGEIRWCDNNILTAHEEFCTQLIYIGHKNAVNNQLTVAENLKLMLSLRGQSWVKMDAILRESGLGDCQDTLAGQLSAGQKQRLSLSRLYETTCPLWILDEPLTALDISSAQKLAQLIEQHVGNGGMVIFTSHQEFPLNVPTKTVFLDGFGVN